MKLVHPDFLFQIKIEENKVTNIIIEAPMLFEKMLSEIYEQINGNKGLWVLSEDSNPIELSKFAEIIINPFDLNINNKKLLSKLYENIKKNTNSTELLIKWGQLYPQISEVIDDMLEEFDYNLEYNDEIDIKEFLKLIDVRFSIDTMDSLEKILEYMNLYNEILGIKVFVLVNLKSFYTDNRLKYLYEQAFYKKYNLLLIENKEYEKCTSYEIRYIIDKDNCVIS